MPVLFFWYTSALPPGTTLIKRIWASMRNVCLRWHPTCSARLHLRVRAARQGVRGGVRYDVQDNGTDLFRHRASSSACRCRVPRGVTVLSAVHPTAPETRDAPTIHPRPVGIIAGRRVVHPPSGSAMFREQRRTWRPPTPAPMSVQEERARGLTCACSIVWYGICSVAILFRVLRSRNVN